ncbi:hypothetical protein CYMTET_4783 [Cymbomonas tetramitiformis]|uniref:Hcy-binding domain-containing protein n=1 Tax=Cymbomonas tetramitiformis TaxID=36881 RepID=A0AAE0LK64_9CHLO|nr:hypothetical protein CYMTET_4783 [Cymbomonas tetramitiformis]
MGGQLCLDGMPQDDLFRKIWSARALVDESLHELVVQTHRRYICAGANAITTSNYGVQPSYYAKAFPDDWEHRMLHDTALAAKLAVRARALECRRIDETGDEQVTKGDIRSVYCTLHEGSADIPLVVSGRSADGGDVRVLGSLPPLCESHRTDLFEAALKERGEDFFVSTYRKLAASLLEGGVDAFILETMNTWDEARLAIHGCRDFGIPIIVCMEGGLRDQMHVPHPETAPEIAYHVIEEKKKGAPIEAFGFNCAPPEFITSCLIAIENEPGLSKELRTYGVRIAAYANCNDREHVHSRGFNVADLDASSTKVRKELTGTDGQYHGYAIFVREFIEHGATIVGGCCGSNPESIHMIVQSYAAHHQPCASIGMESESRLASSVNASTIPLGV